MSLQRRLTLFFILIVILPLAAAGFVVQDVFVGEVANRAESSLRPSVNSVVARYNERVSVLEDVTRASLTDTENFAEFIEGDDRTLTDEFLGRRLEATNGLDFLIALDPGADIAGAATKRGLFLQGFSPPTADEIMGMGQIGPGYVRTDDIKVTSPEGNVGFIVGGFWLDNTLLTGTSQQTVQTHLVAVDQIIASSVDLERVVRVEGLENGPVEVEVEGNGQGEVSSLGDGEMYVLAWTPFSEVQGLERSLLGALLGLLLLAVIATALLAYVLARLIARPLEELTEGARAIAGGRFDHRIPVRSKDEVGQLALSFNEMSDHLGTTITDLEASRDQLQRAVDRVGATLRSTHDMGQILDSILSTVSDAVLADAGSLWLFTGTRDELYPALSRGVDEDALDRLRVGEGIAGLAAERGVTVMLPAEDGGPKPSRNEPHFPVTLAVPLYSSQRVTGVIVLYREGAVPFDRKDLDTVVFLAEQGGVAIENVLLHEDAQRLSLTDGLTGVWNRRYLQMQFKQTLASANRFDRPFSVLLLDLDKFKDVNDSFGHQRGDAILIEFAQRVSAALREIDTFVRYGGEEFVCLLSETDVAGARTTAEKIRQTISNDPFISVGEEPVSLTVSIGVACYPLHGNGYQSLIEAADQALYRAKEEGRDRVRVAKRPAPGLHLAT
ncbi:MAG TPA: diguanylate cyclase [Actinomycetota bacterium]|nr:diguanylate cyclase [Actinomycetota bacterium]